MSSRVRRRVAVAAGFLALGAALTIGVAWAAVAWGSLVVMSGQGVRPASARPDVPESGWGAPEHLDWPRPVPEDWPPLKTRSLSRAFALRWEEGTDNGGFDWNAKTRVVSGLRAGWPWLSMEWVRWDVLDNGVQTSRSRGSPSDGLVCPQSWGHLSGFGSINGWVPRRLPLTPIWPAFIADTLFYGMASAALVLGPLAVFHARRRTRRRRAGQCGDCGYPVHGAICSECGAATDARTRVQAPSETSISHRVSCYDAAPRGSSITLAMGRAIDDNHLQHHR